MNVTHFAPACSVSIPVLGVTETNAKDVVVDVVAIVTVTVLKMMGRPWNPDLPFFQLLYAI